MSASLGARFLARSANLALENAQPHPRFSRFVVRFQDLFVVVDGILEVLIGSSLVGAESIRTGGGLKAC